MTSDQTPDGDLIAEVMETIRQNPQEIVNGLSRTEAVTMLHWAAEAPDAAQAFEMLQLLRNLGGVDLISDLLRDHA